MQYTLLDNNISKETELNHSRKVAWLRSDRQFQLSEGVSASLPYYFVEGEVQSNVKKVVARAKELGYGTLLLGERDEAQVKSTHSLQLVCEAFAREPIDIIFKLRFDGLVLEMLQNRNYLFEKDVKEALLKLLREVQLPSLKGILWQLTPISHSLLQNPRYRPWTIEEMLLEEIALMEEAFSALPILIAEATDIHLPNTLKTRRTILCASSVRAKPWEEIRNSDEGYRHLLKIHNRGMLMMGEGLWPIHSGNMNKPRGSELYWGDCDLFNQFPSDNRLTIDWGILGMEVRLLWFKMLQAKEKSPHRVQLEAWGHQLKELELRTEENPLIRHFVADAWYFLSVLQSQPVHQGISQGGFWKGRPLNQEPQSDGSPWYNASRLFFS
jgi:hypothetical protein